MAHHAGFAAQGEGGGLLRGHAGSTAPSEGIGGLLGDVTGTPSSVSKRISRGRVQADAARRGALAIMAGISETMRR